MAKISEVRFTTGVSLIAQANLIAVSRTSKLDSPLRFHLETPPIDPKTACYNSRCTKTEISICAVSERRHELPKNRKNLA